MSDRFADKTKSHSHPIRVPYLGGSMYPGFIDGDSLLIGQQTENLESGDILFFKDHLSGEFVVHRYIKSGFIKGDYSLCVDHQDITVLGKVIGLVRGDNQYFWGEKGQRFKTFVALLSFYRLKSRPVRILSLLMMRITLLCSSLFYSKTIGSCS